MVILSPTIFASIVASSKDELSRVSDIIGSDCNGDAGAFMNACEALDYERANEILEETFKSLTGHDSITMGLLYFASDLAHKFPDIENEIADAFSDADKIKALNKHYCEIMEMLSELENNQRNDCQKEKDYDLGTWFKRKVCSHLQKLNEWQKKHLSSGKDDNSLDIDSKITLMKLIHSLSAVYAKNDKFLNSR